MEKSDFFSFCSRPFVSFRTERERDSVSQSTELESKQSLGGSERRSPSVTKGRSHRTAANSNQRVISSLRAATAGRRLFCPGLSLQETTAAASGSHQSCLQLQSVNQQEQMQTKESGGARERTLWNGKVPFPPCWRGTRVRTSFRMR